MEREAWDIDILIHAQEEALSERALEELVQKIVENLEAEIPPSVHELGISFIRDQEIQKVNAEHRSKDKPTDVLSFPSLEACHFGSDPEPIPEFETSLGDVLISVETASSQAKALGVTLSDEIKRLLIHGILHLCGYDHENVPDEEVKRMQAREDELFRLVESMQLVENPH